MLTLRNNTNCLLAFSALLVGFTIASLASEEIVKPGAEYPAASPDGTKLVYVSNQAGSRDLWIANASGANASVLTPWPDSDERHPAWAPNGSRIVFSSTRGFAKYNIWVINPDCSSSKQLTFDDAEHEQPRYSPDGASILFLSNSTGKRELWVMNSDGSGQRSIALISARVSDAAWSPDGGQIVYVGCRLGGACNLFRINANGSGGGQITSGDFQDWNPDWGTPGILFASNRGGSQGLWLIQPDGSGLQQVTAPDGVADLDPRWVGGTSAFVFSRSGETIADAASDIWSVTSLGATPKQVTRIVTFDICLQDDSNPGSVFLGNASTGDYSFCCGGTTFTGVAQVARRGNVVTFTHNAGNRRVVAKIDGGVFKGTASLQSPPGSIRCTIQDRDTRNNSCTCH